MIVCIEKAPSVQLGQTKNFLSWLVDLLLTFFSMTINIFSWDDPTLMVFPDGMKQHKKYIAMMDGRNETESGKVPWICPSNGTAHLSPHFTFHTDSLCSLESLPFPLFFCFQLWPPDSPCPLVTSWIEAAWHLRCCSAEGSINKSDRHFLVRLWLYLRMQSPEHFQMSWSGSDWSGFFFRNFSFYFLKMTLR